MIIILTYLVMAVTMWDIFPLSDMGSWAKMDRFLFVTCSFLPAALDIITYQEFRRVKNKAKSGGAK